MYTLYAPSYLKVIYQKKAFGFDNSKAFFLLKKFSYQRTSIQTLY